MDLTLHHIRQLIVQENIRIPAILKMYHTLCDPMQICYQFERISHVDNCTVVVEKMKEYCRPILRLRKLVLEDIIEGISSEDQVDVLSSRAILELPRLLSEVVDFDAPPTKETASMLHFSDSPSSPGAEGVSEVHALLDQRNGLLTSTLRESSPQLQKWLAQSRVLKK